MSASVIQEVGDLIDLRFIKPYNYLCRDELKGIVRYPVLYKMYNRQSLVFAWEVDCCLDQGYPCFDQEYYGYRFEYNYLQAFLLRKTPHYNYQMAVFKEWSETW